ncbi:jg14736 [Pararge aegeria aegeria]|uniref:Jg14736 protein n=1 Tax=Pararge aegeria aegeria TaxID=348720 RepID=A0A8S4SJ57_9NEOP|nr:jg14736 [Pararge aegeria aegeria]
MVNSQISPAGDRTRDLPLESTSFTAAPRRLQSGRANASKVVCPRGVCEAEATADTAGSTDWADKFIKRGTNDARPPHPQCHIRAM